MTHTLKSYIEERVPAWEDCTCVGKRIFGDCRRCHGELGQWHEALEKYNPFRDDQYRLKGTDAPGIETQVATKSGFLIRRHDVCFVCRGRGTNVDLTSCSNCDGTGAEPGTAGPWEVER